MLQNLVHAQRIWTEAEATKQLPEYLRSMKLGHACNNTFLIGQGWPFQQQNPYSNRPAVTLMASQHCHCVDKLKMPAHLDGPLGHDDVGALGVGKRERLVGLLHVLAPLCKLFSRHRPRLQLTIQLLHADTQWD